jgi:hypothetical protein
VFGFTRKKPSTRFSLGRSDGVRPAHGAFEAAATSGWMAEKSRLGHHLPAQQQAIADTAPCTGLTPSAQRLSAAGSQGRCLAQSSGGAENARAWISAPPRLCARLDREGNPKAFCRVLLAESVRTCFLVIS